MNKDKIVDWIQDQQVELMEEYLQEEEAWQDFGCWLFSTMQTELRHKILEAYLASGFKELGKFYEYAQRQAEDVATGGPEYDD